MGWSDSPPAHAPSWLMTVDSVLLGIAFFCWSATYVLMTVRSLQTQSYGMPLLALAMNVSWEMVYGGYVAETLFEKTGFLLWLVLDVGLVYATIRYAPTDWNDSSPLVGRHVGWILGILVAVGCWGNYAFASWWLSAPGIGHGDKKGKILRGIDGIDATELAFWSAAVSQLALSAGSVAMLLVRGHSGGTSYTIWFFRMLGSLLGMELVNGLLWWYWPEAHGFFANPLGVFLCATAVVCDIVYPFLLREVRKSEITLPSGRVVRGQGCGSKKDISKQR